MEVVLGQIADDGAHAEVPPQRLVCDHVRQPGVQLDDPGLQGRRVARRQPVQVRLHLGANHSLLSYKKMFVICFFPSRNKEIKKKKRFKKWKYT